MQRSRVLLVLCLVLAVVPGCKKASDSTAEKAAERAIERATGNKADVNISAEGIKVTGREGGKEFSYEASGAGAAALPKNFPDDIPRYPGAAVQSAVSQGDAMSMVTFQSGDAADRVYEFYAEKLKASGWEIVNEVATPQMRLVGAKKADREVNVTVVGADGKSTVTVVYGAGKG